MLAACSRTSFPPQSERKLTNSAALCLSACVYGVSQPLPTHDGEPQQQVVGVAAAVAGVFVRHLGVVISLVLLLLLGLAGVRLVGCRLVRHPACGHSGWVELGGADLSNVKPCLPTVSARRCSAGLG